VTKDVTRPFTIHLEEVMKTTIRVLALVAMLAAVTASGLAGNNEKPSYDKNAAEQNLLVGLASDNLGLRESCAFMLGEIGSKKAVVPLMAMLHDGVESSRVVAALALSRIGEARGVYAVKQAAKFDRSERVQKLAAWYYNEYVVPGSFDFTAKSNDTESSEDMAVK
jgi:predicted small lipoprotein YifL